MLCWVGNCPRDDANAAKNETCEVEVVISQPSGHTNSGTRKLTEPQRERERRLKLYRAAVKGDWETAKSIFEKHPEDIKGKISKHGDTALHIAAAASRTPFVKGLVESIHVNKELEEYLATKNDDGRTAFCFAATSGKKELVKLMLEKNEELASTRCKKDMLPIQMAALLGHENVVKYLYNKAKEGEDNYLVNEDNKDDLIQLLVTLINNNLYDTALMLLEDHPELAIERNSRAKNKETALHALARNPLISPKLANPSQQGILISFFNLFSGTNMVHNERMHQKALDLVENLWEYVTINLDDERISKLIGLPEPQDNAAEHGNDQVLSKPQDNAAEHGNDQVLSVSDQVLSKPQDNAAEHGNDQVLSKPQDNEGISIQGKFKVGPIRAMAPPTNQITDNAAEHGKVQVLSKPQDNERMLIFNAAEHGNVQFLVKLIDKYPDLILKVDENGYSIFHIAVLYRHERIFSLISETGSIKDLILVLVDGQGNNILHLAAKLPPRNRLNIVSGAALQLRRELLWFEEVSKVVQPLYAEEKNEDGKTPRALFSEEHKELMEKGEEWMKKTAESCMIVAALIATVVFAAAFTVPGGLKEDTGSPNFAKKVSFIIFSISDAISLVCSSCSILTFLSILTSRYTEKDFLWSLPRKLVLGISTLFISIAAMMVVFCATLFILFKEGMQELAIIATVLASIPVFLFLWQQYRLLHDVVCSTYISYRSNSLFGQKNKSNSLFSQKKQTDNQQEKTNPGAGS